MSRPQRSAPRTVSDDDTLRALRTRVREDTGTLHPDVDGVPMIGTGHCHDVCMEAETAALIMTGGFFAHPDGCHYEHSWLLDTQTMEIVDATADQWHLPDFPDIARIPAADPRAARYITGEPDLDADGYWSEMRYRPVAGFTPVAPPADPALRGLLA